MGSLSGFIAEAGEIAPPHIVNEDEDDVWTLSKGRKRKDGKQNG